MGSRNMAGSTVNILGEGNEDEHIGELLDFLRLDVPFARRRLNVTVAPFALLGL
jgi:hypothetical protein